MYVVRGIYNVQDADFNLSQFGMFLQNDTLFLTVHLNDIVERLGRKPMSGDVIEFPHMKEDYSLDESVPIALEKILCCRRCKQGRRRIFSRLGGHTY